MDKAEEIPEPKPEPIDFWEYARRRKPVFLPPLIGADWTQEQRAAFLQEQIDGLKEGDYDFDCVRRNREYERSLLDEENDS